VLGREADPGGLQYFTDRFGTSIEPGEAIIFQNMAQAEIQARNAFLAQQSAAAQATALAEIQARENQGKTYFYQADVQAEQATILAAQQAAAAATAKAVADAYAAAQAAAAKAAAATTLAAKQAADALRVRALVAVKALYLQVLGREGDQAGLDYFADRFGDVIDPDELQIFSDMSKPEIDARNKYLADMAAKSKEDAAKAKAIADQFAATAAKAKADAAGHVFDVCPPGSMMCNGVCVGVGAPTAERPNPFICPDESNLPIDIPQPDPSVKRVTTSGGINPALILAAAAAFFFAG
jgi:hypothetical protein